MPVQPPVRQVSQWLDAVVEVGRSVTDREATGHNLRVARLCVHIGRQLSLSASELRVLAQAGLMHDIGGSSIPDSVPAERSTPNEGEWELFKSHPGLGTVLMDRPAQSSRQLLAVLYHHERLDGSGYPYGLSGRAIPLEARIVAVADTYDATISGRSHRRALTPSQARKVLQQEAGTRLDSRVVAALFAALDESRPKATRSTRRALAV